MEETEIPELIVKEAHADREKYLGLQVIIQGYFNLDGPAYLLDNYEYAITNVMWPMDAFIVLDILQNTPEDCQNGS